MGILQPNQCVIEHSRAAETEFLARDLRPEGRRTGSRTSRRGAGRGEQGLPALHHRDRTRLVSLCR